MQKSIFWTMENTGFRNPSGGRDQIVATTDLRSDVPVQYFNWDIYPFTRPARPKTAKSKPKKNGKTPQKTGKKKSQNLQEKNPHKHTCYFDSESINQPQI